MASPHSIRPGLVHGLELIRQRTIPGKATAKSSTGSRAFPPACRCGPPVGVGARALGIENRLHYVRDVTISPFWEKSGCPWLLPGIY